MGKVLSAFRGTQYAYVQQQAEKIISQSKPVMHPLYPTEEKVLNRIRIEHPELNQKVVERRKQLEENVNKLRIVSRAVVSQSSNGEATQKESQGENSNRPLPQQRLLNNDIGYGLFESTFTKTATPGKVFFRDLVALLGAANKEQDDESRPSSSQLATDFGVEEADVRAITAYFAPFNQAVRYDFQTSMDWSAIRAKEEKARMIENAEITPDLAVRLKELSKLQRQHTLKIISDFNERKRAEQEASDQKVAAGEKPQ